MPILLTDNKLEILEMHQRWFEAKNYLYSIWIDDKLNLNSLLRVATECWYILTFWDRIDSNGLEMIDFAKPLTEAKNFGLENFKDSDTFSWVLGMMIISFPYWFTDFDGQIDKWEKSGQEMIKTAYKLNHNNLIAKMLSLPWNSKPYHSTRKMLSSQINELFPGNSAIEVYYRSVLT